MSFQASEEKKLEEETSYTIKEMPQKLDLYYVDKMLFLINKK
jgi:hypothetical protein